MKGSPGMAGVSAGCSVTLLVTVSWELLTCGEVPRQRHGAAGGAFGLAVSFIKLQDTLMLVRQFTRVFMGNCHFCPIN